MSIDVSSSPSIISPGESARVLEQCRNSVREIKISGEKQVTRFPKIADFVVSFLDATGDFIRDENILYYLDSQTYTLVTIQKKNRDFTCLLADLGLNATEKVTDYVTEALVYHAYRAGKRMQVHHLAYYDKEANCVYVHNHGDTVFKITSEGITPQKNGEDGILFVSIPGATAFQYIEGPQAESLLDSSLLDTLRLDEVATGNHVVKPLLRVWILAPLFKELLPTRPILAAIGEKGSRKTTLVRCIGKIILGPSFEVFVVSDNQRDFQTQITNLPYVALDNADSPNKWLKDALATTATGGTIARRELYSDNNLVSFQIQAFLALTSMKPYVKRDDITDRMLVVRLKRHEPFIAEGEILEELANNRDEIWSEILDSIPGILRCLEETKNEPFSTPIRIADYAKFAWRIAPAIGYSRQTMKEFLDTMNSRQMEYLAEDDPLLELIDSWLTDNPDCKKTEYTSKALYGLLKGVADDLDLPLPFKSVQSLAQRLSGLRKILERDYGFRVHEYGSNRRTYSFLNPVDSDITPS